MQCYFTAQNVLLNLTFLINFLQASENEVKMFVNFKLTFLITLGNNYYFYTVIKRMFYQDSLSENLKKCFTVHTCMVLELSFDFGEAP